MGIPIKNIFLTELNFVRTPEVPDKINYTYTINVGAQVNDNHIAQVFVELKILEKELKSLKIDCCMVGLFDLTHIEDMPFSTEDFLYINAPAIIFPYLRETVSNLTLRAGIKPLIIPTFNFKEMREKKQDKDNAQEKEVKQIKGKSPENQTC